MTFTSATKSQWQQSWRQQLQRSCHDHHRRVHRVPVPWQLRCCSAWEKQTPLRYIQAVCPLPLKRKKRKEGQEGVNFKINKEIKQRWTHTKQDLTCHQSSQLDIFLVRWSSQHKGRTFQLASYCCFQTRCRSHLECCLLRFPLSWKLVPSSF